jgi:GNAT superfamily N-acetyltransferase
MSDSTPQPAPRPADPSGVLVRRATVADRDQVRPLVLELPRHDPEREPFDRSFGSLLAALDTYFAVAEVPGAGVVGYVLANRHLSFVAGGTVCRVEEVAVAPGHRRRGVGGALLQGAEDWAVEVGARRVGLASGLSEAFYVAGGYEQTAGFFTKSVELAVRAPSTTESQEFVPVWAPPD